MSEAGTAASRAPQMLTGKIVGQIPGGRLVSVEVSGRTYLVFVPDDDGEGSGDA